MDVSVVPPDDDLGWAELDISLVVPSPGSVWEQWLPLKEGGSGEVLIRLAHLAPSTAAQGALPLPGAFMQPGPGAPAGPQPSPEAVAAAVMDAANAGVTTEAGSMGEDVVKGLSWANQTLLETVSEQVSGKRAGKEQGGAKGRGGMYANVGKGYGHAFLADQLQRKVRYTPVLGLVYLSLGWLLCI